MAASATRAVDVNWDLFGRSSEYEDLIGTGEVVAIAEAAPACDEDLTPFLTPPAYYTLTDGIVDDRRINDALLVAAMRIGGRACGVAEPRFGAPALAEIERIAAAGAVAVMFSPRAQGVFGNDQIMIEICRHAGRCGLVAMVRSAPYSVNESLPRLWDLARACGDTRFVIVGAFASWENIQLARWNRGGPDNVRYEISGLAEAHDMRFLVQDIGSYRLLYGSGGSGGAATIRALVESVPEGHDRALILSGNAHAMLDLAAEGKMS